MPRPATRPASKGDFPLYVPYEDYTAGVGNVMLTASYDGGITWSSPIQVNDNASPVDEFQPNLTVAADGTVSVNFHDRRLACPAAGTGLALDQVNPNYTGSLPHTGRRTTASTPASSFTTRRTSHAGDISQH